MERSAKQAAAQETRLKRLAQKIGALAEKDESILKRTREVGMLREKAAAHLHALCVSFVAAVNELLPGRELIIDPAEFTESWFNEDASNLIQLNVRGRILQIEFHTTPELVSTEEFRMPYTLEGTVRAFNQELLDKDLIEEQLLFFTFEKEGGMWRFFDARTYRSGPFDREYLVTLMEQLI